METDATRTHDRNPMAKSKSKAKTKAEAKPVADPAQTPAQKPKAKGEAKPERAKPEPMPPHVLAEMVAIVKEAMERKGWTANRLARETRIDAAAIYKFLAGSRSVSMTTFARCLDVLGLSLRAEDRQV